MSNKIRGPERNFGQIRLVSGSLDRPCHDLYYTQLKCYRAVRASRDISHFVHFLRKTQVRKKNLKWAEIETPIATSVRFELCISGNLTNIREKKLVTRYAPK